MRAVLLALAARNEHLRATIAIQPQILGDPDHQFIHTNSTHRMLNRPLVIVVTILR